MTPQQRDTLKYIEAYEREHGVTPTMREIARATDTKAVSAISRRLARMEAQGLIRRTPGRARSIELVKKFCKHCGGEL